MTARRFRTTPALTLAAGLIAAMSTSAEEGSDALLKALERVNAQSPQDYPEQVAALPEPAALAAMDNAKLLPLLTDWNPAVRVTVAAELGRRGDSVAPQLREGTSSENWMVRAGAVSALTANIGAMDVSATAASLESACRAAQADTVIISQLDALLGSLDPVLAALDAATPGAKEEQRTGAGDADDVRRLLRALREALQNFDGQSRELADQLVSATGAAGQLQDVIVLIDNFDFGAALAALDAVEPELSGDA